MTTCLKRCRHVSVVIGWWPKIAPKKQECRVLWDSVKGAVKTVQSMVHYCPYVSVVLGNVIDFGEARWWLSSDALSRLRD